MASNTIAKVDSSAVLFCKNVSRTSYQDTEDPGFSLLMPLLGQQKPKQLLKLLKNLNLNKSVFLNEFECP